MLNSTHPDDDRLSALAGRDPDAVGDGQLATHVGGCSRCADLVDELSAISASLAELPDVAPPRPLRLLPAADPEPGAGDRLGGWVRRFFTPLVTAGAALALVGAVGTAAPELGGMGGQAAQPATEAFQQDTAEGDGGGDAGMLASPGAQPDETGVYALESAGERVGADESNRDDALTTLPAERSPWPMVLFGGVAVVVATLLLRWILDPRAG